MSSRLKYAYQLVLQSTYEIPSNYAPDTIEILEKLDDLIKTLDKTKQQPILERHQRCSINN